ncbi:MAG: hypothetical protein ABJP34_00130 [Erythrobacter sp.]
MPIWSEILVLSLAAYALGIGVGWLFWGSGLNIPDKSLNESED